MAFDLNQEIVKLLQNEPFFAALSRRIDKRPSTSIPTAGVRINPDTCAYEMVYNPDFYEGLTDAQRQGVTIHEFYHLVFDHVGGRRPDGVNHLAWNVATDLAINSLITEQGNRLDRLPEGCCVPGGPKFEDYPHYQSSEKYLEMLKNDPDKQGEGEGQDGEPSGEEGDGQGQGEGEGEGQGQGQGEGEDEGEGQGGGQGKGSGNFDDHSGWEENANSAAADIAKQKMKETVRKAAEEAASGRGFGSAGGHAKKLILDSIKTKVDWRKVLRSFTKATVRADKRSTVKRINKRYPMIHAGKKVRREARIAVCIDQSGSVDDGMLVKFYTELNKLCDLVEFDIVPFDTRVGKDHVYTWKKGQKRARERVMYGGTCFDAPTEWVNKSGKYDGMIILTDMMAPKPKRAKCKRLWMTTAEYAARPYFNPKPEKLVVVD